MREKNEIEISMLSIVKVFIVVAAIFFLYWTREAILLIFISLILAAAFQPIVKKTSKVVGKPLAITLLVVLFLALLTGFIYLIVPLLVEQTKQLVAAAPGYIQRFQAFRAHTPVIEKWVTEIGSKISELAGNFVGVTVSFVGGLISFFTVVILTIYFLIDEKMFTDWGYSIISEEKVKSVFTVIRHVSVKVGNWLRGQLILGLVIACLDYIGLIIIGVPYALTIAVISGLLEIVPIIGPFISGAIAALIALSISPVTALVTIAFYIVIQQLENNLLVPKIMQKAIGLPPAIIIVGILIFGQLMGTIGALLAVPILGIVSVLFEERKEIQKIFSR